MNEVTIQVPYQISEQEAKLFLAIKLFEIGKISLGEAAKMTGYSKLALIEIFGHYKTPIFNYTGDDLKREMKIWEEL